MPEPKLVEATMYQPITTIGIIVATCLFSWRGLRNRHFEEEHIFHPASILAGKQFYRLLTSGFLHADFGHLAFNMLSFYVFAESIELFLGWKQLLLIYFGSIIGGHLLSLWLHRNHDYYAYGASGGVCGVIFAHIFLFPGGSVSMFFLPIGIPSWLYAILFLVGTFYALRAKKDNIGHDAHLGGAMVGLALTAMLNPEIMSQSPKLFCTVGILSLLILVCLVKKPLFLPLAPFTVQTPEPMRHRYGPSRKPAKLSVDALLDKISERGLDSLTKEERAYLDRMSEKYRNRATTREPESKLLF